MCVGVSVTVCVGVNLWAKKGVFGWGNLKMCVEGIWWFVTV